MKRTSGLIAILLPLLPLQAQALSCMRPTVEGAFTTAHEAPEAYVPVLGQFRGTLPPRPTGTNPNPEDRVYDAQFTGVALTKAGTDIPMNVPVTIAERCLASWCPAVPDGEEVLTFLRVDGNSYVFEITACAVAEFFNPDAAQIATMRTCLQNGGC